MLVALGHQAPLLLLKCVGVTVCWQEVFAKEEIDLEALQLMNEEDLKQMGIKKGPRMKLIKALGLGATATKEEL